ncbi:hypothetical protein K1719_009096 [Acacia pycnantha]|nr:hypothetical protein K1719_009096 [Acacia pycnantha]
MARLVYHCISFFFLSTVLYTLCYAVSSSSDLLQTQTPLFTFGDSMSDPGNNNYLNSTYALKANFNPYGITFFKCPTGRFSDGRLVPDFIAEYAEIPLIPPYLQPGYHRFTDGANFASAGAGVLDETGQGMAIPLKTQLEYFKHVEKQIRKKVGDVKGRAMVSRAVYLMNIGSNDYIFAFATNSSLIKLHPEQFVEMVIGNLTAAIKDVYEKGGRKFWVPNLALLQSNELAKLHNQGLLKMLQKLETQLEGFKYSTSDFYSFLVGMIFSPSRHGLKQGKKACCGRSPFGGNNKVGMNFEVCHDPSDYVFFDGVHPTEAVYQKFARIVWNGSRNQTWPYNLKELFEAN